MSDPRTKPKPTSKPGPHPLEDDLEVVGGMGDRSVRLDVVDCSTYVHELVDSILDGSPGDPVSIELSGSDSSMAVYGIPGDTGVFDRVSKLVDSMCRERGWLYVANDRVPQKWFIPSGSYIRFQVFRPYRPSKPYNPHFSTDPS